MLRITDDQRVVNADPVPPQTIHVLPRREIRAAFDRCVAAVAKEGLLEALRVDLARVRTFIETH